MFSEIRLHGSNTDRSHTLNLAVLAEEPKSEINIVDRAVDKDSTREFGVRDEETTWIQLVAGLRPEDGWSTDIAISHASMSIAVGCVEAAREAANDLLVREFLDGGIVGVDD